MIARGLRCASAWQSVQQHTRTGPQPGLIFYRRYAGIRARGNRVVHCQLRPCATSGTSQTKTKMSSKNYSLRTSEEERARDERCQSPSSLTAERAGIGGISWALSTGWLCCSWVGCWDAVCLCVVLCCCFFVVCCVLCVLDPRKKKRRAPFQVIVRRGMPLHESGMPLTTANVAGGAVHVG